MSPDNFYFWMVGYLNGSKNLSTEERLEAILSALKEKDKVDVPKEKMDLFFSLIKDMGEPDRGLSMGERCAYTRMKNALVGEGFIHLGDIVCNKALKPLCGPSKNDVHGNIMQLPGAGKMGYKILKNRLYDLGMGGIIDCDEYWKKRKLIKHISLPFYL